MTRAFISYHHKNDQDYKEHLTWMAEFYDCFSDGSVGIGEIEDDGRSSQSIRRIIRDEYLRDSKVTILLGGIETRFRKHVDWELKSSMIDGRINRRSGILVINLPGVSDDVWHCGLPGEKEAIYPDYQGSWTSFETKSQYKERYEHMPQRVIDNLFSPNVKMSVTNWSTICDAPEKLKWLIDESARAALHNDYDLSLPMRRRDHNTANALSGLVNRR